MNQDTKGSAIDQQAIIQEIMNVFFKAEYGPEKIAFCLGACLKGTQIVLQQINDELPPEVLADLVFRTFIKGFEAKVIPVDLSNTPQQPH